MSQKKAKKFRKEPVPYTYAGLSYYRLSLSADRENTRNNYLKKSLSYIAKAKSKDKDGVYVFKPDYFSKYGPISTFTKRHHFISQNEGLEVASAKDIKRVLGLQLNHQIFKSNSQ